MNMKKQNLPSIDEIWFDRDLMLAFREYLYQQLANDNLSFYLTTLFFENLVSDNDLQKVSEEIFERFITPNAPNMVNLDYDLVSKIEKGIKKSTPRNIFHNAQEIIYQNLESQWFPEFLGSPLYKACNDETIEYNKSDGGKERSNTMGNYDDYVTMKRKRNKTPKGQ